MTTEKGNKALLQQGIISAVFAVLVALTMRAVDRNDQAAPRDYVDKQLEQVRSELKDKADKGDVVEIKSTLRTMDARLYDIWKASNNSDNSKSHQ